MSLDDDFLSICHADGDPFSTGDLSCISLSCSHRFHLRCIRGHSYRCLDSRSPITCPLCYHSLSDNDISKIDRDLLQISCEVHSCPQCGIGFLYEPGLTPGITKDPNGQNIRPAALECLRQNRCTCPGCRTPFCISCKTRPFHDGYTCEEQSLKDRGMVCRFCDEPAVRANPPETRICSSPECGKALENACFHILPCGHPCSGLKNELRHFGCGRCDGLYCGCCEPCNLSPSIVLACGHRMHLSCAEKVYQLASKVKKIELPKCLHPGCRVLPEHPALEKWAARWRPLRDAIEFLLPKVIAEEGLEHEKDHVNNPDCEEYFHKPLDYARDLFVWFMCDKCHNPYYGGHRDCGDAGNDVANYACAACSRVLSDTHCKVHGDDQMLYKCFYCCKPALFFCWGTTHFCAQCHLHATVVMAGPSPQCDGRCQFAPHQPNGTRKIVGYCATCEAERARRRGK